MNNKRPGAPSGVALPTGAQTLEKPLPDNATPDELKDAAINITVADLEERVASTRDSWETESLFEDAFEELVNGADADDGESTPGAANGGCTAEESARLKRELREYGPTVFCQRTVDSGRYTAKKLLTAFGIKPPTFLEGGEDEDYYSLLSLAITRELSKRAKLPYYNSLGDAVDLIKRCSNIVLLTGAGISTSLGIPDFRSKGTGLYSKLEHLGLNDPQEVFDISIFKEDPTIFYSVAKDIVPATDLYTPTHKFIAMLHERGKLLTNYSQNIDNLEVKAGVPKDKLIQCHGSFGTASCIKCGYKIQGELIFPDIKAGKIPTCTRCVANLKAAGPSAKRKRSQGADPKRRRKWGASAANSDEDDDDSSYDVPQPGVMKPDITFFGEALPDEFSNRLTEHDRDKVDLVIVIGTSLKVTPVSEIVSWLPSHIPQIYVSRQAVNHINFDIDLLGDCDTVVTELCKRLGWEFKHEMVQEGATIDVRTEEGSRSRHVFTQVPTPSQEKRD